MREHPWHIRRPTTRHYEWYEQLRELHQLTSTWLKEFSVTKPPHLLTRGIPETISDSVWMLESLANATGTSSAGLDDLLDDTSPDDLMSRLEHTVWAVQSWTLYYLLEQTSQDGGTQALQNQLEQIAWKCGRDSANSRWKDLPARAREDLRGISATLRSTPMSGFPDNNGFLIRRAIPNELHIEMVCCPHSSVFSEIRPVQDELCALHAHWMRGFVYALNTGISLNYRKKSHDNPHCRYHWTLSQGLLNSTGMTSLSPGAS